MFSTSSDSSLKSSQLNPNPQRTQRPASTTPSLEETLRKFQEATVQQVQESLGLQNAA